MNEVGLFLVPTPIGNLEDITLRALSVLKSVDMVLTEDTRTTGRLLKHFKIDKPLKSYHAHNEHKVVERITDAITSGKKIALVSDAGTPGISDPGFLLVRSCLEQNIRLECLPGATALIPALVKSGFPTDRFVFEGFLPHKKGRLKRLEALQREPRTIIFYESPHRLIKLLEQIAAVFGIEKRVSVSREITKIYEETITNHVEYLLEHFNEYPPKGEFVVILEGNR